MKRWQKIVAIIGVLLIVVLIYRQATATPAGITTTKVDRQTLTSGFTANGKIKAQKAVDLKFNTPAKVAWISVKPGDKVRAWQGLAGLDATALNSAYQISLNNLRGATANVDQVLDSLQGHTTDETYAQRAIRTTAQVAHDNAYDTTLAAKDTLNQSMLIAPFAGTVLETNDITSGMTLSGADLETKFIRLVDLNSFYFEASVDEVDYSKIKSNQEAVVTLDAFPGQSCLGQVTRISLSGRETTGGVVTFPVRITLNNCPLTLALNLNGQAQLIETKVDNALVIPKKYLVIKNGQNYVYLQTGSSVKNRKLVPITLGISSSTDVQIIKGLNRGDTIIYLP